MRNCQVHLNHVLAVVCGQGKSHLISGVYPEQFELRSSLFDGLKVRQNPESTNYRYIAQLQLYMAGPWEISIEAHADGFEPIAQTLIVQVE